MKSSLPLRVGSQVSRALSKCIDIEIERKFVCNENMIVNFEKLASAQRDIYMKDVYFDTADYILTKNDMWLRDRNNRLELKWPQTFDSTSSTGTDFYLETTNQELVRKILLDKLKSKDTAISQKDLRTWMNTMNLSPFCYIDTRRKRYSISIPITTKDDNKDKEGTSMLS